MAKDKPGVTMAHGTWVPNRSGQFILRGLKGHEQVLQHKQGLAVVPLNREPFYRLYEQNAVRIRQQRGNEPGWVTLEYPREKHGEWHQASPQVKTGERAGEVEICLMLAGKEFYRCKIRNGAETKDRAPEAFVMDETGETPEGDVEAGAETETELLAENTH